VIRSRRREHNKGERSYSPVLNKKRRAELGKREKEEKLGAFHPGKKGAVGQAAAVIEDGEGGRK